MIPEKFKEKMKNLLGDEYPTFIDAIENGTAVRGLRVNLIKTCTRDFLSKAPFNLTPIPYVNNGFILNEDVPMGPSAYHHAGAIYMQDPGAMATVASIDVESDWWVADLCAAPGGKSSQVAERLGEDGFLLSNEYVPRRAKIIVSNFERLGVKNAIVTSLDTKELADMYSSVFDLVITDAPCSGEGMFRKSEDAILDWSEENVNACAIRQTEIINNAAGMVKPGGYLLYSTCTYSPEENEGIVTTFLSSHEDYSLVTLNPEVEAATRPGIVSDDDTLSLTRRFYPHVTRGEGQFVALMKRSEKTQNKSIILYKDSTTQLSKQEMAAVNSFFKASLSSQPIGRIAKHRDNIVIISHNCPIPNRSVFMSGVLLGEIKGTTFIPSHQFFSCYGDLFINKVNLTESDTRVAKYLAGEEIDAGHDLRGWCCITYEGIPLGGGKASDGKIKNHYPKGLRTR